MKKPNEERVEESIPNMDYKYALEDFSRIYIGAKYTYEELIECEDVPMKLRSVVMHYMVPGASPEISIGEHVLRMEKTDSAYAIMKQLKTIFRVNIPKQEKKGDIRFGVKDMTIDEIMEDDYIQNHKAQVVIVEMVVPKLRLATVSI